MFSSILSSVKDRVETFAKTVADTKQEQVVVVGDRKLILKDKLGEGGFAYVYSAEEEGTGRMYALKRMLAQTEDQKRIATTEINLLKKLKHRNIIGFHGASKRSVPSASSSEDSIEYFLLMELGAGSLIDVMSKARGGDDDGRVRTKFSEKKLCNYFKQICLAVQVLHSQNPPIAHRDLKIENILVGSDGNLKLCDFGSCITKAAVYSSREEIAEEEDRIQKYSTAMYRAPEMADLYRRQLINEKVDIWALGCILYTMAYFVHPFQEGGTLAIISGKYDIPEDKGYSTYVGALIKRLFTDNPVKRPDINRVLEMTNAWEHYLETGKSIKISSPTAPAPAVSQEKEKDRAKDKPKKERKIDKPTEQDWAPDWDSKSPVKSKPSAVASASPRNSVHASVSPRNSVAQSSISPRNSVAQSGVSPRNSVAQTSTISPTARASKPATASVLATASFFSEDFLAGGVGEVMAPPSGSSSRPSTATSTAAATATTSPSNWRCGACTFENSEPALSCRMCQTPKASIARPSWAAFRDEDSEGDSEDEAIASKSFKENKKPGVPEKPAPPSQEGWASFDSDRGVKGGGSSAPTQAKKPAAPELDVHFESMTIVDKPTHHPTPAADKEKKSSAWLLFDEMGADLTDDDTDSEDDDGSSPIPLTQKTKSTQSTQSTSTAGDAFSKFDWDDPPKTGAKAGAEPWPSPVKTSSPRMSAPPEAAPKPKKNSRSKSSEKRSSKSETAGSRKKSSSKKSGSARRSTTTTAPKLNKEQSGSNLLSFNSSDDHASHEVDLSPIQDSPDDNFPTLPSYKATGNKARKGTKKGQKGLT